jgi:hypothetical protein
LQAQHLSVAPKELDALATTEPYRAFALDVATLKANPDLPGSYSVSGSLPMSAILTVANRNDVTQRLPLVDAIPPIRAARGRPLQKPKVIYADRGYDSIRIVNDCANAASNR